MCHSTSSCSTIGPKRFSINRMKLVNKSHSLKTKSFILPVQQDKIYNYSTLKAQSGTGVEKYRVIK